MVGSPGNKEKVKKAEGKPKSGVLILILTFFLVVIGAFFLLLIVFGFFKFANSENLSNVDALSFQISLLGIIIATITMGGGILAIIGWQEINSKVTEIINRKADDFIKNKTDSIVEEVMKKTNERMKAGDIYALSTSDVDDAKKVNKE